MVKRREDPARASASVLTAGSARSASPAVRLRRPLTFSQTLNAGLVRRRLALGALPAPTPARANQYPALHLAFLATALITLWLARGARRRRRHALVRWNPRPRPPRASASGQPLESRRRVRARSRCAPSPRDSQHRDTLRRQLRAFATVAFRLSAVGLDNRAAGRRRILPYRPVDAAEQRASRKSARGQWQRLRGRERPARPCADGGFPRAAALRVAARRCVLHLGSAAASGRTCCARGRGPTCDARGGQRRTPTSSTSRHRARPRCRSMGDGPTGCPGARRPFGSTWRQQDAVPPSTWRRATSRRAKRSSPPGTSAASKTPTASTYRSVGIAR